MKAAGIILNEQLPVRYKKWVDYSILIRCMELYADQYKQESEVLKKEIAKAKMIVEGLMQDNQRLRELSQELLEALKYAKSLVPSNRSPLIAGAIQKVEEQLKQQT